MKIIAYQYMADRHCIGCTLERFQHEKPKFVHWGKRDENGIPVNMIDSECNVITPVFSTDENQPTHCGTCRQPI